MTLDLPDIRSFYVIIGRLTEIAVGWLTSLLLSYPVAKVNSSSKCPTLEISNVIRLSWRSEAIVARNKMKYIFYVTN